MSFAFAVNIEADGRVGGDNVLGSFVFFDVVVCIEKPHVGRADAALQMKDPVKSLRLCFHQFVWSHCEEKVHRILGMILAHLCDHRSLVIVLFGQHFQQPLFVILCPLPHWQFGDFEPHATSRLRHPKRLVSTRTSFDRTNGSFEATIPRHHGNHGFPLQEPPDVCDDIARVVIWNLGAPASADSVGSVHERKRNHRTIPIGFDSHTFLTLVVQNRVVVLSKNAAQGSGRSSENVSRGSVVLAAL
mmetsp:Transcript_81129/g.169409  ORF Transcript_81129/g.169409 Transcript_81129/m.169409 type:complete len:245 (-) Transcript_81129:1847-2581(-)